MVSHLSVGKDDVTNEDVACSSEDDQACEGSDEGCLGGWAELLLLEVRCVPNEPLDVSIAKSGLIVGLVDRVPIGWIRRGENQG